jgi:serine/threonine protein kinase
MPWLGSWLARREARMFQRLAGDPNVPAGCGPVHVDGQVARHAVAHEFIPGRTLLETNAPSREVIQELQGLLTRLKQNGIAYVDLHKLDNILIGDDGKPYLIDFQISVRLPRVWPLTWLLCRLHQLDRYHLLKHVSRLRPDLCDEREHRWVERKPWLIRVHRCLSIPLRQIRRTLFVRLGVRTGKGESFTELGAEPPVPPALQVPSAVSAVDPIESSHARSSIDLSR